MLRGTDMHSILFPLLVLLLRKEWSVVQEAISTASLGRLMI
jgi:hypothetical protein